MKIVLDTSVFLTAFFFEGFPRQILEAIIRGRATAYATREIVEEYEATVAKMRLGKPGNFNANLLLPFTVRLHIVTPKPREILCRDPNDDKFISCAISANAFYVVMDSKKASFAGQSKTVKIITAEAFCQLLSLCA